MRIMEPAVMATLLVSLSVACQSTAGPLSALTGEWGGKHIGLSLDGAGGRLEYDCAAGAIAEPLRPDAAGGFRAAGTHTPGEGGPDRIDHVPPRLPALYEGRVTGNRLTLRVRVSSGLTLGPFMLRRGVEPTLLKCL
jgi:hypothetical protein